MLSDLVPGAILSPNASYWTGTPLRQHRSYALMRTWLAPEMPRPGCVWTHALILRSSDLSTFDDLGALEVLFQKPSKGHLTAYETQVLVNARALPRSTAHFDRQVAEHTVLALYAQDKSRPVFAQPGDLDDVAFQVWSQQWPRLRRSFSFCTAVTRSELRGDVVKLDLRARGGPHKGEVNFEDGPRSWLDIAVDDLPHIGSSPFRKFLSRYGADLRRGRPQFRLLAEIYARTRNALLTDAEVEDIIDLLSSNLPDPAEGARLKFDLFSAQSELLPHVDAMSVLRVALTKGSLSLTNISDSLGASLKTLWPARSDEIFALAEQALEQPSDIGDRVVSLVTALVGSDDILKATARHPRLRARMISATPHILDSTELATLPTRDIIDLIDAATLSSEMAKSIISRCLLIDEYWFSSRLFSMFGDVLLETVFDTAVREGSSSISPAFRNMFRSHADAFTRLNLPSRIHFLSEGWRAAHLLGWDSYSVMRLGASAWSDILESSDDDLDVRERLEFFAFLMSVALENLSDSVEDLIGTTYVPLLKAADARRLTPLAIDTLKRHLPYLGYSGGSIERRLSAAVARGYVIGALDPSTFHDLVETKLGLDCLIREVEDLVGGSRFLQSLTTPRSSNSSAKQRRRKDKK